MDQPLQVPYSMMATIADLQPFIARDGVNHEGRHDMLRRYVSRTVDKVYDCAFIAGEEATYAEVVVPAHDPIEEN